MSPTAPDIPERENTLKPHPALLLVLKTLQFIEAERNKELDYADAIGALETAAYLLRKAAGSAIETLVPEPTTYTFDFLTGGDR